MMMSISVILGLWVIKQVTNDKSIDINFMVKEERFRHINFTVLQALLETIVIDKVEDKKLLEKKKCKTNKLRTYNKKAAM